MELDTVLGVIALDIIMSAMNEDLTLVPPQVREMLFGSQKSDDARIRNRGLYLSLLAWQQAEEDPSLLESDYVEEEFNRWRSKIFRAIANPDPDVFRLIADAVEAARDTESNSADQTLAIAWAFASLRAQNGKKKVDSKVLKEQTRYNWAFLQLFASDRLRGLPKDEERNLIERRIKNFVEPNWSREFENLGITHLVAPGKGGRPPKKLTQKTRTKV